MVNIPDTIAVLDLGGGTVGSLIKTICRLDDLIMKPLQKQHPATCLNSIFGSIYDPYVPGSGEGGHFRQVQNSNDGIYAQIN